MRGNFRRGWQAIGGMRLILLSFGALGLWFSLVIPPFETPDEHYHYAFARHLAQGNPLPVQAATPTGPWQQEGSQAPLYYWLAGRLTAGIEQRDFETLATLNPRANLGDPLFPGNKNRMLYSAADWPLRGANLALRIGRWLSVLLGGVTLWVLYATARLVFPQRPGLSLVALAIGAWLPQFVFLSASFTNDTLVIALASLTVWWLARLVVREGRGARVMVAEEGRTTRRGVRRQAQRQAQRQAERQGETQGAPVASIPWWEWGVLGVLLGLAALSKLQGLGLWLLAALAGGLIAWRRRDGRVLLYAALPVALPALAIAGWWYWRNFSLYGDWTGLSYLAAITGERGSPLTWAGWWREFRGLRYSSWGLFGWFNLLLPIWVYAVLDGVTLLAVGGGVWTAWTRFRQRARAFTASMVERVESGPARGLLAAPANRVWAVLGLWVMISAGALLYWISRAEGSQGRLIFPALVPLVLLLVAGLDVWARRVPGWTLRLHSALPLFLLACTLYTGAWLLPRAYAAPQPIAQLPAHVTPVEFRYGEHQALHLLAIDVAPGHYVPGDTVDVTVYMQMEPLNLVEEYERDPGSLHLHPSFLDYQLFIQFLDPDGTEYANLTTHPGWGRNPTSLWQPGAIYADTYPVRVARAIDAHSPLLARIYVGFVNPETEDSGRFPIRGYDRDGEPVDPTIAGQVALYPQHPPAAGTLGLDTVGTRFGATVELAAAAVAHLPAGQVGGEADELHVQLLWEAVDVPPGDLTAFVHVLDADDEWRAGHDAAPAPRFPTQHWQPGDRVLTEWTVELPADLALDEAADEASNEETGDYQVWVGLYPAGEMGATRTPITADAGRPVRHDMVRIR